MEATIKFEDRKPLEARAESPTRADAGGAYKEYVEKWKREEGAPEGVIRAVCIDTSDGVNDDVEGKDIEVHLGGGGGGGDLGSSPNLLPEICEMTDWMLERSRR